MYRTGGDLANNLTIVVTFSVTLALEKFSHLWPRFGGTGLISTHLTSSAFFHAEPGGVPAVTMHSFRVSSKVSL